MSRHTRRIKRSSCLIAMLLCAFGCISAVRGGDRCELTWVRTFDGQSGGVGPTNVVVIHDDGSGPALYMAGYVEFAGGLPANRIARWDGHRWWPVGGGMNGTIWAMTEYDDGSGGGLQLYAAGDFTLADGQPASRIARWNGTAWSAIGSILGDSIRALEVFDFGAGPELVAAGYFHNNPGGLNYIARWNGRTWRSIANGFTAQVRTLAVFDKGSGPVLYAAGDFTSASGGLLIDRVALWDNSSGIWRPVGSSGGADNRVRQLMVMPETDGHPVRLMVQGLFAEIGGQNADGLAAWDGHDWTPIPNPYQVDWLVAHDDGSGAGPRLYGDASSHSLRRLDGQTWTAVTDSPVDVGDSVSVQSGDGPKLYVAMAGVTHGLVMRGLAVLEGQTWTSPGEGPNDDVRVITALDDTEQFHIGGSFTSVGSVSANRIAHWDGATWSALGSGLNGAVDAIARFDDGSGDALYVGGEFTSAGTVGAPHLARWNGRDWAAVGAGTNAPVDAMVVFDDGRGPALYVGGDFTFVNHVPVSRIARFDGVQWDDVGGGVLGPVRAMTVYDDGTGPALYVGGFFTSAGGQPASRVAKWDGATWTALGSGVNGEVRTLVGGDAGLYVGGTLTTAGGRPANRIALWDGSGWETLGDGLTGAVSAIALLDQGCGETVYAGGFFTGSGMIDAPYLARWDGASWWPITTGTLTNVVFDIATTAYDGVPALLVGGAFEQSPVGDSYIARMTEHCADDLNEDGAVDAADLAIVLATWGLCLGCDADLDGDGEVGPADLSIMLAAWGRCVD